MKIRLIRHAEVNITKRYRLSCNAFQDWVDEYKQASILKQDQLCNAPPLEKNYIISSSLPRCTQTAMQLFNRIDCTSNLYQEAEFSALKIPKINFKPQHWSAICRFFWLLGYKKNTSESKNEFLCRIDRATQTLIAQACKYDTVTLVSHYWVNRFIAKKLKQQQWHLHKHHQPHQNLGSSIYIKETEHDL
ncbi:MAG: phosphoglycerate mutase family protein [Coxiellaceae bacterium]|nr:phosphoglycerate mutase family protein [Coxiellaceae bacterium]